MLPAGYERRTCFTIPANAHTLHGFREWVYSGDFPDYGRISLIEGEIDIDLAPERLNSHNQVRLAVQTGLMQVVDNHDRGDFYGRGAWLTNDAAELSTEPDAMFATWETRKSGKLKLIICDEEMNDGIELRGCPDWVLEVVGPYSARRDGQLLLSSYHKAGVQEYWLIDARKDLRFTIFTRRENGYFAVAPQDGWLTSPVFLKQFRFEREKDCLGDWDYHLHARDIR